MRKACILLLFTILMDFLNGQVNDTLIYENYSIVKRELLPGQYLTRYYLLPDSTWIHHQHWSLHKDSKDNYQNWKFEELNGTWRINKNTLILKRGDLTGYYKINKRYFKWKRIQVMHDGGRVLRYHKWIFEKRAKYNRVE